MITRQDTLRHQSLANEPAWQESFFLGWADVQNRCACHCHISLSPNNDKAHLWAWLIVDGKEIARRKENNLPIPRDDFDNITIDIAQFIAGETIRDLTSKINFDGISIEVDYQAYTDPVELSFDKGKLQLGSHHYESMGSVRGRITLGDREINVNGWGWQDHSWGIRQFSSNPAGRWVFAAFDETLAISAMSLASPGGNVILGYVMENGVIRPVKSFDAGVTVADDGISPIAARSTIWTACGRGYTLTAQVLGCALVGGPGWAKDSAFMAMDGLARFEFGGRIGGGLIEVANPRTISDSHKAHLGIPQ